MSDYIEREAVIDVFRRYGVGWRDPKVKGAINSIPAADVRPVVRGKWIPYSIKDCLYYCSNCNALPTTKTTYCPNCGAKMEES